MATAIKYGMKGDDVKNLQTTLNNLGYSLDVDGNFGPQTLAAVKNYQQANGLDVDGMVGPQTQAALSKTGSTSGKTNTSAKTSTATTGSGSAASAATKVNYPDAYVPGTYTNTDPSQSETVLAARATIDSILAQQPVISQSKWQDQINGIIDQILNRKAFNYDFNEDALYKQYAEQYTRRGKLAMQDTMGQAAAMTGGYGSSYASTAGNQAYQEYLSQLNEVIPELYGMALDRYQMEGQDMYNQYSMLSAQEQQDYARQMDKYNMWRDKLNYATDRYDTEYGNAVNNRNFEYGVWADDENRKLQSYQTELQKAQFDADFAEGIRQYEQKLAYQQERDAVSDSQWAQSFSEQQKQNEISNEQWNQSFGEQQKQNEISNEQWETSRQDKIDSENKAYAREDVLATIANGGTPSERDLKIAGWTKDQAAAHAALSSGDSEAALEHVSSMSYADIIDMVEGFVDDGNMFAAEGAIDDAYLTGRIDLDELQRLKKQYKIGEEPEVIDTTVPANKNFTGGGGGKILQREW